MCIDDASSLKILSEETVYPKNFASYAEKEYVILFWFDADRNLHEGNHAVIFPDKITDLGAVLDEITVFYLNKGINPAIWHPHYEGYFTQNESVFAAHGYKINVGENNKYMILSAENSITVPKRMDIRRLTGWDERIATDIILPSGEPWEIESTKVCAGLSNYYLFAGFIDGNAVVYTLFHTSAHGNDCTRFDYVLTAPQYRRQGYGRELVGHVTDFCRDEKLPVCFQWAGVPESERITTQAGFRVVFESPSGYASYIYAPNQKRQ